MKRWIFSVLLIAMVALTACTPSATATTAPANTVAVPSTAPTNPPASGTPQVSPTPRPTLLPGPSNCAVTDVIPAADPTQVALLPPITDKDWVEGPANATVTFIEYSDFQCPYCSQIAPVLGQLQSALPNDVRVIYRSFPLTSIHDKSMYAAQAGEAAGLQGKFWEMHDAMFLKANWDKWTALAVADFPAYVDDLAKGLGLDMTQFAADVKSDAVIKKVNDNIKTGGAAGVSGTPFLFVNNLPYGARNDLESLKGLVEFFKLPARAFKTCPATTIDVNKTYTATVKTERGDIVIQLLPKSAPTTVNSFIFLAKNGWFDNAPFHRVVAGFVAQTGDPSGTGFGSPGYQFGTEIDPALKFDKPGMVGMARGQNPESNGSQWFITFAPQPTLDGQYTIFGQVISGMDVVNALRPRDASKDQILLPGDKILSITIEEK